MAKKFGKFLLVTAAIGATVAATYYLLKKKDSITILPEDEDYDDFSDDFEDDCENTRNYVPLTPETVAEKVEDVVEKGMEAVAEKAEEAVEKVEEFLDEE